jgi:heme exporter protein D
MSSIADDERKALVEGMRSLASALHNFDGSRGNSSNVRIEAGGAGVWLATTCCLVMLAVALVGSIWLSRELTRQDAEMAALRDRNETFQAYINVLMQKKDSK